MPIYEYECQKCHRVTEALRKFTDGPLTECPHCGGRMDKLMSMNSFQLKGGGWYVTDYARKNDNKCAAGKTAHGSSEHGEKKSSDCAACQAAEKPSCPAAAKES
ncbi:MAG: zinc ribbon domain-containing protein [Deltaproteobacteria bacterium]|jgi:putative FmdB family regulatory protein|nr:zinc ribbon domain-containing protein [Deltaproteobacteria bacterium]